MFNGGGKTPHWLAHRLVWVLLGGDLPADLHHECKIKTCVNPACLSPLTKQQHTHIHAEVRHRTHCANGHEFTLENTYWRTTKNGQRSRQCRRCKAIVERQRVKRMSDAGRSDLIRKRTERRRVQRARERTTAVAAPLVTD